MAASDVISAFNQLSAQEQSLVKAQIQLPDPPNSALGAVWIIVVATLAVILVGGLGAVVFLIADNKPTEVVVPIVTTALGFVGGLLAPSPKSGGS